MCTGGRYNASSREQVRGSDEELGVNIVDTRRHAISTAGNMARYAKMTQTSRGREGERGKTEEPSAVVRA